MNFVLLFTLGAILVGLAFAWMLRNSKGSAAALKGDALKFETRSGRGHATYLPVIRQAMSATDFQFLAARAPIRLLRRAHKERQRVARLYLGELRDEFQNLLRLGRVIAVLSPELRDAQRFKRLRLTLQFFWRYQILLLALYSDLLLLPLLCGLGVIVSELAVRMEDATKELGERAALAGELASSLDRRRLDLV